MTYTGIGLLTGNYQLPEMPQCCTF